MPRPVLIANDVSKAYVVDRQPVAVLESINLQVSEGEWVALTGSSGSGKTTLLQVLGVLDTPSSGSIIYYDADVAEMGAFARARLRRQRIGFIFQSYHLFPELNAIENVMRAARAAGTSRSDGEERAQKLLADVGMSHRYNHYPAQLSGGEQQRVAIARALLNQPDIVLADEPTGNLDEENAREIMAILQRLRDEECRTIVMVTHDLALAQYADRHCLLESGRLQTA
jgi:ABC-type lipoprotein export system ATPase subunit